MCFLMNRLSALLLMAVLSISVAGYLTGCATQAPVEEEEMPALQWPSLPEPAVIRFVGTLSAIEDLKMKQRPGFADLLAGKEPEEPVKTLNKPFGVFGDANERLFVADTALGALIVFDRRNDKVEQWGDSGLGQLTKPIGVTVGANGQVYVADATAKRIVVFDSSGKFLNAIGGEAVFTNPVAVAVNNELGRIYVADSQLHQIKVFDLQGKELFAFGGKGSEPGQFMFPSYLAMAADGRLFVSDTLNFRVQIFDPDGQFIRSFGQIGQFPGDLNRPKGIALDRDGHVYVADASFNNFQIFDEDGALLLFVGEGGGAPGQFALPTGMHIDDKGTIFVADQYNHRIQIFQYLGKPENTSADDRRNTGENTDG